MRILRLFHYSGWLREWRHTVDIYNSPQLPPTTFFWCRKINQFKSTRLSSLVGHQRRRDRFLRINCTYELRRFLLPIHDVARAVLINIKHHYYPVANSLNFFLFFILWKIVQTRYKRWYRCSTYYRVKTRIPLHPPIVGVNNKISSFWNCISLIEACSYMYDLALYTWTR